MTASVLSSFGRPIPTLTRRVHAAPQHGSARTPWAWAAAGAVIGLLVGLLWFAPARWLAWGLERTGAPLGLQNPVGTLWNGQAQLVFRTEAQGSTALPGALRWRLRLGWRNYGPALDVALRADCCLNRPWVWQLSLTTQGMQVQASNLPAQRPLRIPAAVLTGLGTPWNTLQLQGQLELSAQALVLQTSSQGLRMQGSVQLDALGISTSLSTLRPVGSYRIALQGAAQPVLTLRTLEGALQLQGTGMLQASGIRFDGEASAAQGREDALANLLNIIGQRQGARSLIHLG